MKHEERRRGAAPFPAASSSAGGAGLGEMALARHEIEREGEAGSDEGQGEIKPALARTKPDPHRIGHDPDHEDRPGRQYVDGEKSGGAPAAKGIEQATRQETKILVHHQNGKDP